MGDPFHRRKRWDAISALDRMNGADDVIQQGHVFRMFLERCEVLNKTREVLLTLDQKFRNKTLICFPRIERVPGE